jgi:type II secretory pathway pseudopilin PulG
MIKNKIHGAGLIELLLVIIISGTIIYYVAIYYQSKRNEIQMERQKTIVNQILNAMNRYYYKNCGKPTLFAALQQPSLTLLNTLITQQDLKITNVNFGYQIPLPPSGAQITAQYINMRTSTPQPTYPSTVTTQRKSVCSLPASTQAKTPIPLTVQGTVMGYYYPYTAQVAMRLKKNLEGYSAWYLMNKMGGTCLANSINSCCLATPGASRAATQGRYIIWLRPVSTPTKSSESYLGQFMSQVAIFQQQYSLYKHNTSALLCQQ